MKNREACINKFIKTCLLQGYSQEETEKLASVYLKTLPEVFNFKERFCEFLKIQKEIEPKWSYHEKFYQKVINDYDYFLQPMQELLDMFMLEAPPRTGKTELITGFGVPYLISQVKNKRFAILCGHQALKRKLRKTITRIIKSNYFLEKYKIRLTVDNSNEIQTSNDCLVLFTTTLSEVPIGEGFHYIFMEDALTHTMIKSPAKTENAFEQIDGLLTRTQDDPRTKVIINNQRLGFNDLSAKIEEGYKEVGRPILKITMPYYFENETIFTDKNNNEYVFKENEFLISRFDNLKKDLIIGKIGKSEFTTQYMQNPVDDEDVVIKQEWWNFYHQNPVDLDIQYTFFTTDLAFSDKKTADFSVVCCWGKGFDGKIYLLEGLRIKALYMEVKQIFINFYNKWNGCFFISGRRQVFSKSFYIEKVASSEPLFRDLQRVIPCVAQIPRTTDKYSRVSVCQNEIINGFVKLPANNQFAKDLIQEAYEFRKDNQHKHDDMVDCLADAITQEVKGNTFNYKSIVNSVAEFNKS